MARTISYRQWLISRVALARRRAKEAKRIEARYLRERGKCPDDQIIYEVYESEAALSAWEHALIMHRQLAAPRTNFSPSRALDQSDR